MAYTPYTPTQPGEVDTVTRQWLGGARSPGVGEREKEAAVALVVTVVMKEPKADGSQDTERVTALGGFKVEDGVLEVHSGTGQQAVVRHFPLVNVREYWTESVR